MKTANSTNDQVLEGSVPTIQREETPRQAAEPECIDLEPFPVWNRGRRASLSNSGPSSPATVVLTECGLLSSVKEMGRSLEVEAGQKERLPTFE